MDEPELYPFEIPIMIEFLKLLRTLEEKIAEQS